MNDKLIQQGWEYPRCGRVYSPTTLKLDSDVMFDSELIGKRFFLSREEAEKALKERETE